MLCIYDIYIFSSQATLLLQMSFRLSVSYILGDTQFYSALI